MVLIHRHRQHRDPRLVSAGQWGPQHPGGRRRGKGLAGHPGVCCGLLQGPPHQGKEGKGSLGGTGSSRALSPPCAQRISRAMALAAPWLILAGSGGVADVLATLLSHPRPLPPQAVRQQLKEKFPSKHFSWEDVLHWTELVGAPRGQSGRQPLLPDPTQAAPAPPNAEPQVCSGFRRTQSGGWGASPPACMGVGPLGGRLALLGVGGSLS